MEIAMKEPVQVYIPESSSLEFDPPLQDKPTWNDDPLGAEYEYLDEMEEKFQPITSLIEAENGSSSETDERECSKSTSVAQLNDNVTNPVLADSLELKVDPDEYPVRIKEEIVDGWNETFEPQEHNFKVEDEFSEEEVEEYPGGLSDDLVNNDANGIDNCEGLAVEYNNSDKNLPKDSCQTDKDSFMLKANLKSSIQNRYKELSLLKSASKSMPLRAIVDQETPIFTEKLPEIEPNISMMKNTSVDLPARPMDVESQREKVTIQTFVSPEKPDLCSDFEINMREPFSCSFTVPEVEPNILMMKNTSVDVPACPMDVESQKEKVTIQTFVSTEKPDLCSDFEINMQEPFSCHVGLCKKKFLLMDNFISHIREHKTKSSSNGPYCCDICRKRFALKRNLTRHNSTVHNCKRKIKTPFTCDQCSQGFMLEFDLISHKLEHEIDASLMTPHSHNLHENQFPRKKSLEVYRGNMINPVGRKSRGNFVCKLCTRRFLRKQELVSHMEIHNANSKTITLYGCKLCPYQFSNSGSLKRHHTLYHKNNPNDKFSCEVCTYEDNV